MLQNSVTSKMKKEMELMPPDLEYEEQHSFKILREFINEVNRSNDPYFLNPIEDNVQLDPKDYHLVIQNPVWLAKIKENLLEHKYSSITAFVSDMRLMLENCYRYHGPDHSATKKGVKLEVMMEQKLVLLPKELRDKTTLEATSSRLFKDQGVGNRRRQSIRSIDGTSVLLSLVKNEKANRDKELRRKQMEERKAEKEEKEKEVVHWEENLLKEPIMTEIRASWEIPQIAHFLIMCRSILKLPEVPVYEFERSLLMPQESLLFSKIMTCLLTPSIFRVSSDKPLMPYHVWNNILKNKIRGWYKLYQTKNSAIEVFEQLGIEMPFFHILGKTNPLEEKLFHELTFHQRVWLVKSLCDQMLMNNKGIQAITDEVSDANRECVLGQDVHQNSYIYFPQFSTCCLRIYRQAQWTPPTSNSRSKKQKNNNEKSTSSYSSKSSNSQGKSPNVKKRDCELNIKKFELVAESVQSLRVLIYTVEEQNSSFKSSRQKVRENEMGKKLLRSLKTLLSELEPMEIKFEQAVRRFQCKLYKEWNEFCMKRTRIQCADEDTWESESDSVSSSVEGQDGKFVANYLPSDVSSNTNKHALKRKQHSSETAQSGFETMCVKLSPAKRRKQGDEKMPANAARGLLISHSKQNTISQAKELFAWETLRQILIAPTATMNDNEQPSSFNSFPLSQKQVAEIEENAQDNLNDSEIKELSSSDIIEVVPNENLHSATQIKNVNLEIENQVIQAEDCIHNEETKIVDFPTEENIEVDQLYLIQQIAAEHDYAICSSQMTTNELNNNEPATCASNPRAGYNSPVRNYEHDYARSYEHIANIKFNHATSVTEEVKSCLGSSFPSQSEESAISFLPGASKHLGSERAMLNDYVRASDKPIVKQELNCTSVGMPRSCSSNFQNTTSQMGESLSLCTSDSVSFQAGVEISTRALPNVVHFTEETFSPSATSSAVQKSSLPDYALEFTSVQQNENNDYTAVCFNSQDLVNSRDSVAKKALTHTEEIGIPTVFASIDNSEVEIKTALNNYEHDYSHDFASNEQNNKTTFSMIDPHCVEAMVTLDHNNSDNIVAINEEKVLPSTQVGITHLGQMPLDCKASFLKKSTPSSLPILDNTNPNETDVTIAVHDYDHDYAQEFVTRGHKNMINESSLAANNQQEEKPVTNFEFNSTLGNTVTRETIYFTNTELSSTLQSACDFAANNEQKMNSFNSSQKTCINSACFNSLQKADLITSLNSPTDVNNRQRTEVTTLSHVSSSQNAAEIYKKHVLPSISSVSQGVLERKPLHDIVPGNQQKMCHEQTRSVSVINPKLGISSSCSSASKNGSYCNETNITSSAPSFLNNPKLTEVCVNSNLQNTAAFAVAAALPTPLDDINQDKAEMATSFAHKVSRNEALSSEIVGVNTTFASKVYAMHSKPTAHILPFLDTGNTLGRMCSNTQEKICNVPTNPLPVVRNEIKEVLLSLQNSNNIYQLSNLNNCNPTVAGSTVVQSDGISQHSLTTANTSRNIASSSDIAVNTQLMVSDTQDMKDVCKNKSSTHKLAPTLNGYKTGGVHLPVSNSTVQVIPSTTSNIQHTRSNQNAILSQLTSTITNSHPSVSKLQSINDSMKSPLCQHIPNNKVNPNGNNSNLQTKIIVVRSVPQLKSPVTQIPVPIAASTPVTVRDNGIKWAPPVNSSLDSSMHKLMFHLTSQPNTSNSSMCENPPFPQSVPNNSKESVLSISNVNQAAYSYGRKLNSSSKDANDKVVNSTEKVMAWITNQLGISNLPIPEMPSPELTFLNNNISPKNVNSRKTRTQKRNASTKPHRIAPYVPKNPAKNNSIQSCNKNQHETTSRNKDCNSVISINNTSSLAVKHNDSSKATEAAPAENLKTSELTSSLQTLLATNVRGALQENHVNNLFTNSCSIINSVPAPNNFTPNPAVKMVHLPENASKVGFESTDVTKPKFVLLNGQVINLTNSTSDKIYKE